MSARKLLVAIFLVLVVAGLGYGQGRDSTLPILNLRGPGDFVESFNNYSGLEYTENQLAYLHEQVIALDSAGHNSYLFLPYNPTISQEISDLAMAGISGEKSLFFYMDYGVNGFQGPDFIVKVTNPDLDQNEIPGIEQDLINAMKLYSQNESIPDVFAKGIERYLSIINWEAEFRPYFSGELAPLEEDEEMNPSFELSGDVTLVAVSGYPIPLPGGTRVKFFKHDASRKGMVHSFLPPGSPKYHTAMEWVNGLNAGDFAGYGYFEESSQNVYFYSYEGFLTEDVCGKPPYKLNEVVEVLLGFRQECSDKGQLHIVPKLYRVPWADITAPNALLVGYPGYRAANSLSTYSAIEPFIVDDIQAFDDACSQETVTLQPDVLQKIIPYPCGITRDLVPITALSSGNYAFIKFDNGNEAVMTIHEDELFLSYVDASAQEVILKHDPYYGWYYTDLQGAQFSSDVSTILTWAGELAINVGITGAFIAVNIALGGTAAAMAAPYGVEIGAVLLVDLTLSAGEAGVVYMLTDNSNVALQTFVAGAVGSVGGTLITNVMKGARITSSDDLDALLKFHSHNGSPVDGPLITKKLSEFEVEVQNKGLNEQQIDELLKDMEASDDFARYMLTDPNRAKAWKYANEAYPDKVWCAQ